MRKDANAPSHIVGIGASAGGLEAFDQFFSRLPSDSGMAFVVIQHLDPVHKGMLPELLQRQTTMRVQQIEDGMVAEPNCIYVIPPNSDISIMHGTLNLTEPVAPRGLRMPVDIFFRYLAEDRKDTAVGVILSGMGTDGTLGIRAIKEKLGIIMVQDPDSAKFDGMPGSAIATGMADFIAPAEELPVRLMDFVKHATSVSRGPAVSEKTSTALQKIFAQLRAQTGQDFSLYKKETIQRRIKRRMDVHLISHINEYIRYLQENAQEVQMLFKELLIGVTSFFRDPEAWDVLKENIAATVLKQRDGGTLRAWVVACSTGEEAYSIAMVFKECVDALEHRNAFGIQVFATDIDKDAVDIARRGMYDANIAMDVSPERLARFFVREEGKFRLKKEIRDMLIFAPHNIIMDPPFTKMDVVTCRNLLIYFSSELQKRVMPLLHYSQTPGGVLLLGPSETMAGFADLYSTLDNKWKVFQRRQASDTQLAAAVFPTSRSTSALYATAVPSGDAVVNTSELAQQALLEDYSPPAVLINDRGDILHVNGRTGKFLEPSPGKANLNIYAMAREGLRHDLGTAIRKANIQNTDVTLKGLTVKTDGDQVVVDVTVKRVTAAESVGRVLLVVFQEVQKTQAKRSAKPKGGTQADQSAAVADLEEELKHTKERLQSNVEQMLASHEELQSANEELQSTNEELQSTNEELMTSKEEMQSLNEELATVNAELQAKVDLLSQSNNDLRNLLNSTEIATIFLDNKLCIRRFTSRATDLIKMIDTDVGRPVTDLVSNLRYDGLARDARNVLDTLVFHERQVQTIDNRWHLMRIMPYRTLDNVIDGIVITFVDISALKQAESSLQNEQVFVHGVVEAVREPLVVLDAANRIVDGSGSFYEAYGLSPEETVGKALYDLTRGEWDKPEIRRLVEEALPSKSVKVEQDMPGIGRRTVILYAHRIERANEPLTFLAIECIDAKGNV